ncbi:MAG: hypothetical protein BWY72_01137 [Bacteroidetes bacterium ADurb.Bin416]|nr:MAG: hypothetical protein BWY72_01137 [Bacteroidetes bacterium ADurb.Bin416]
MIHIGSSITKPDDPLNKIDLDTLYHQIQHPRQEVVQLITKLRIVRSIDKQQYSMLKKQLPYYVCGIFYPPIRKTAHFAWIDTFIVDIDHLSQYGKDVADVRKVIQSDPRTVLCFLSPGEDGLKVVYKLKEKCHDAGHFSLFYKCFASSLVSLYSLENVIDFRTNDVTRACFASYDVDVYYNPEAESIDMGAFLDFNDMEAIAQLKHSLKFTKPTEENVAVVDEPPSSDPDIETMKQIRLRLNPKQRLKEERACYVPGILQELTDELNAYLSDLGYTVVAITSIQYGKKIQLELGLKRAEVNIFYGKRGFSVVQTPKNGTSAELNQLSADCIESFLLTRG